MDIKQSVAISIGTHKKLKKHLKKTREKVYVAVERFIEEGIKRDNEKGS